MRSLGITIITKPLRYKAVKCKHCNYEDKHIPHQKGVDVALVTQLMSLATEKAYDIAIVISGDNDFEDAINYVKSRGQKVWLISFINALGRDTMRSADKVIQLDKIFDLIIRE